MPKIYIVDVTNRDGVQTANLGLAKLEKTMLNIMLAQFGVFQNEFGFPTTCHEVGYLNANLELAKLGVMGKTRMEGWMRALPEDVVKSKDAVPGLEHINLSASTSDQMIDHKFKGKKSKQEIIDDAVTAVKVARDMGIKSVGVNSEDASRTDRKYLLQFAKAVKDSGADRLRYCDTLGYENPFSIYKTIREIAETVGIPIELHCHGDLGMAVACSLAGAQGAIDGGVDTYINTTVNAIGERAGNADLVSVILGARYSKGFADKYELADGIDLTKAWKLANYVSKAFNVPIPVNQAGVGMNCFAHASGIHADGVLKDPYNYELYGYEELGRGEPICRETGRIICSGQYGGVAGFIHIMKNLGIEFKDKEEAQSVLNTVRYANLSINKPISDEELIFVCQYPEIAKKILTVVF